MSTKQNRVRKNITLPIWVHTLAAKYGKKRGYGLSELITTLLVNYIAEEQAIERDRTNSLPICLLPVRAISSGATMNAAAEDESIRELRAMGL